MRRKFLLLSSSLLACVLLSGCGPFLDSPYSRVAPVDPGPPVPLDLNGNWLITGDLPIFSQINQTPANQLNFATTLFVKNDQVTGGSVFSLNCNGNAFGKQNYPIAGTVDDQGNFAAKVGLLRNGEALTINGKAPSSAGGVWSGSFTYTPGCNGQPLTKPFTTTALGALTGTYTGTTTLGNIFTYPPANIAISMQLQQGAVPGNINADYGVTGTITVTGSTCFHTGTVITSPVPSDVEGNGVNLAFLMDDGSTFGGFGQFTNLQASTISISELSVSGGSCDSEYVGALTLQR